MSSGKLRRERSSSRERHSRKEGDVRTETGRQDVSELNEEEYDEEWEHEWEDIDEIGKGRSKFPMSHGRAQFQKWRGRNQSRGQHRFNKWDRSTGSDNFSESNRKSGRRPIAEEEEMLDMDPGVEMTNLKVKIQDGKRFAEPDEFDNEMTSGRKNYTKFSRGRGSRGYHGPGRDRWTQGNKYKPHQPDELVDCREVLNRRKRHIPDQSESDLREKLQRKDPDLGDLREIIESRDHGAGDLRALIDEPPDISLMHEFSEDIIEDIDLQEDINLQNEYFEEVHSDANGNSEREFPIEDYDVNERYEFVEEPDLGAISPRGGSHHRDVVIRDQNDWPRGRWQRSRSRERSFGQAEGWSARNRRAENWRRNQLLKEDPVLDQRTSAREIPFHPRSRSRDHSQNRSRERVKSPPGRNFRGSRGSSFDRGMRLRGPSWDRERSFGSVSPRSRGLNITIERERSFERDERAIEEGAGRRQFPPELGSMPSPGDNRRQLRSPSLEPGRRERERSIGRDRNRRQRRSISQEAVRGIGRDRSRSNDRRFRRGSQEARQNRRSVSAESGRMLSQERNQDRGVGRDRKRSPHQERNWGANRATDREIGQEGNRNFEQGRNRNFNQERNRSFDQDRTRNFNQESNRNFDQERNMVFNPDRNKSFNQERNKNFVKENKRSADREFGRVTRWDSGSRNSRDRSPRGDTGANLGRERLRSPNWGGPRTPSAESYREPGWDGAKSPPRERSRSRGRLPSLQLGHSRDDSRGREPEGRSRDQRDRGALRAKEPERREKIQDRRRDQEGLLNRPRAIEKESVSKMDKNRKRDHEDSTNKERGRGLLRSPDLRNQDKITKKTPQMLVEEFKQRYVRESGKVEKFDRREEYLVKQVKDTVGQQRKLSGGQEDSREWENIRDFQERRNAQPVVGLPFLDESRRPRDNTQNQQSRSQLNRGERVQGKTDTQLHGNQARLSSAVHHQIKDTPLTWQNHNTRQTFNNQEEDRRRSSRWGSPSRRDKPSDHRDSHKTAPYSTQSAAIIHQSSSNGKADGDFWRRNLPSLGDSQSQWNKPRSDLPSTPGKDSGHSTAFTKHLQSPKEVIFVRGLARDVTEMDIRTDVSNCGLWAKDVRVVHANDTGVSRGLAFITFNSVDEATRWMELRRCVLNLRPNNHAVMEYSNPILKDWECVRCLILNFKNRTACYQCNRTKEDCLDGWEETCPYPTNALLLRGLNPVTSIVEISKALKSRMIAHARLDGVRMGADAKGRPRTVCFVQLTSVTDSMTLHKSLVNEPLIIDNCQVSVAYCQLDKLPPMNNHTLGNQMLSNVPMVSALPTTIPPTLHSALSSNNIPVVARTPTVTVAPPAPAPAAKPVNVTTASIRSMLEGNYTEKDIPTLAQYCASAYAKNPQEQAAYIRYYTKHYKEKLQKSQVGGGK